MMATKRLIDANALIHRLCTERDEIKIKHACDIGYHNGLNMCVSIAINAPTVDAVEVVHGRWIRKEQKDRPFSVLLPHCSECGALRVQDTMNYCPNCGAKMDGDGNG